MKTKLGEYSYGRSHFKLSRSSSAILFNSPTSSTPSFPSEPVTILDFPEESLDVGPNSGSIKRLVCGSSSVYISSSIL